MPKSRVILKILFSLSVWSFVMIGLFKLHGNNVILQEHVPVPISGRLLLQKDNKYMDPTSTTTDRNVPADVLVDNRTGKLRVSFQYLCCYSNAS